MVNGIATKSCASGSHLFVSFRNLTNIMSFERKQMRGITAVESDLGLLYLNPTAVMAAWASGFFMKVFQTKFER